MCRTPRKNAQSHGSTGYAIGLSYPPGWGERTLSFRRGDTTLLQPGMTFHFMPALWLDDGGIEITETGHECLSTLPGEVFVKLSLSPSRSTNPANTSATSASPQSADDSA